MRYTSIFGLAIVISALAAIGAASFLNANRTHRLRAQESDTVQLLGVLQSAKLREVSGVTVSRRIPEQFWLHNDSGSGPILYLVSSSGKATVECRLSDAASVDWEDICSLTLNDQAWLIIGDVGDNSKTRETCTLYLLPEPELTAAQSNGTSHNIHGCVGVSFRYADGPRNCEAIGISADTRRLILIEKVPGNLANCPEPGVYELDLSDCFKTPVMTSPLVAERIATIPIRDVTGMDLTEDGRKLIVRNYFQAFLYERSERQTWQDRLQGETPTPLTLPVELQGEAICFSADEQAVITTSEFAHQPIWRTNLPSSSISKEHLISQTKSSQEELKKLILPGEAFEFDGHVAFIFWPEAAKRAKPQPWVFYAPTLPAYPDEHERWMHQQFLDAGIAVAGIDVGEAYGNPLSRGVFDKFYGEMIEHRGFSQKPCLLGRSRGGLWVSSWAADHPERFAGMAGIYPVFDWRTYPGVDKAAPAYGITEAELLAKAVELNPISRAARLAEAHLPVFLIHGDQDTVVPLPENSAAMAKAYEQAEASEFLTLQVAPGQGHNMWEGFFRSRELVNFVIKQCNSK